jgi:hypothetical protein
VRPSALSVQPTWRDRDAWPPLAFDPGRGRGLEGKAPAGGSELMRAVLRVRDRGAPEALSTRGRHLGAGRRRHGRPLRPRLF